MLVKCSWGINGVMMGCWLSRDGMVIECGCGGYECMRVCLRIADDLLL